MIWHIIGSLGGGRQVQEAWMMRHRLAGFDSSSIEITVKIADGCCAQPVAQDHAKDLDFKLLLLSSWSSRCVGLLRHQKLDSSKGVVLEGTGAIHSFGMRFDILAVFVDIDWQVLGSVVLRRGSWARGPRGTAHTIEIHPLHEALFRSQKGKALAVKLTDQGP
jgi:hypothetical protein